MDFAISFQKGFEHHKKSVVSPSPSQRIHCRHNLHFVNPEVTRPCPCLVCVAYRILFVLSSTSVVKDDFHNQNFTFMICLFSYGAQISLTQIEFCPKIALSLSLFLSFSVNDVINIASGLSSLTRLTRSTS